MIVSVNDLSGLRAEISSTIALRFGTYDLLHIGHKEGIDFAASQADILVLGIMPDQYVRQIKGATRPVIAEQDRLNIIDQVSNVDYSFVAPVGKLALAKVFWDLHPDVYIEEVVKESRSKATFLSLLGINYCIDTQPKVSSTSLMIAALGVEEALVRSSLLFKSE